MKPVAACNGNLRQCRLIWAGAGYRLAVAALPPLTHTTSSSGYELYRHNADSNKLNEKRNQETNRSKGELRASSIFPLGGYSALPRTGGITRPLEARPYGQTMPAQVRARHLDLAAHQQQARKIGVQKTEWSPAVEAILSFPKRLSSYPERKSIRLNWASDGFSQCVSTLCLFHAKLEKFFVWSLFEFLPTSKKLFVCRRKPMITILSRSELEST